MSETTGDTWEVCVGSAPGERTYTVKDAKRVQVDESATLLVFYNGVIEHPVAVFNRGAVISVLRKT